MFMKIVISQEKKIIQQDKEIKELNEEIEKLKEENNCLYEENKSNRSIIEDLEADKRHIGIVIDKIKNKLFDLQDINRLGNLEGDKNIMRNRIINSIIKELADSKSN